MIPPASLEQFLEINGLTWRILPTKGHWELAAEWQRLYGSVWKQGIRTLTGVRAQAEYANQHAEKFNIVPFLTNVAGPHSIRKPEARSAAYECSGSGKLPNLAEFCSLDFFVVPIDFSWGLIHTHEDAGLGGPYFVRRDWVISMQDPATELTF